MWLPQFTTPDRIRKRLPLVHRPGMKVSIKQWTQRVLAHVTSTHRWKGAGTRGIASASETRWARWEMPSFCQKR